MMRWKLVVGVGATGLPILQWSQGLGFCITVMVEDKDKVVAPILVRSTPRAVI